jgi:hypothetical protein
MSKTRPTITNKLLQDVLITALEGGSNYWYMIENDTKGDYLKTFLNDGLLISNRMILNDYPEEEYTEQLVTLSYLRKVIKEFQCKKPFAYSEIKNENFDAGDADQFLQIAIFGEVIYG